MLGFSSLYSCSQQLASFGLGPLTEADLYKAFASENKGINRYGHFKTSASVNGFWEVIFCNHLG